MRLDLRGTVKGQSIELDEPLDLSEGERVEIVILRPEIISVKLAPEELEIATAECEARCEDPAYRALHPIPPGGYVVTNEMVNRIRETAGF